MHTNWRFVLFNVNVAASATPASQRRVQSAERRAHNITWPNTRESARSCALAHYACVLWLSWAAAIARHCMATRKAFYYDICSPTLSHAHTHTMATGVRHSALTALPHQTILLNGVGQGQFCETGTTCALLLLSSIETLSLSPLPIPMINSHSHSHSYLLLVGPTLCVCACVWLADACLQRPHHLRPRQFMLSLHELWISSSLKACMEVLVRLRVLREGRSV